MLAGDAEKYGAFPDRTINCSLEFANKFGYLEELIDMDDLDVPILISKGDKRTFERIRALLETHVGGVTELAGILSPRELLNVVELADFLLVKNEGLIISLIAVA